MGNKDRSSKELRDIHRIITIVSEIDSVINEYLHHSNIDNLKGIIKSIVNYHDLTSVKQNIA